MTPELWLLPSDALPTAQDVLTRVRTGGYAKAVALVGYREDAEAGESARRLPYGHRGEGIEEIVFLRTEPTGVDLVFADDAWPGEDRTWVTEDLDTGLRLVGEFASELDADRTLVIVTGEAELLDTVAARMGP